MPRLWRYRAEWIPAYAGMTVRGALRGGVGSHLRGNDVQGGAWGRFDIRLLRVCGDAFYGYTAALWRYAMLARKENAMMTQAEEMVEAPERLSNRAPRLEGAYEQVGERLRDLQGSVDSLRAEQAAATEGLRAEQSAQITALGDGIRSEMNTRFNTLTTVLIGAMVAQFGTIIGLAAIILPRL